MLYFLGFFQDIHGGSLNIVFFEDFKTYSGLWPFSVFPRCQYEQTELRPQDGSRTPTLQLKQNTKFYEYPAFLYLAEFCQRYKIMYGKITLLGQWFFSKGMDIHMSQFVQPVIM